MARGRTRNAGDRRQVRRSIRSEAERRDRFEQGLGAMMLSLEGRAAIWGLLSMAGVFEGTFDPSNSHQTAFNAGRQSIGQELLTLVCELEPDLYLMMEAESRTWERRERQKAAAAEAIEEAEGEGTDDGSN